jgi:hypothetical protein
VSFVITQSKPAGHASIAPTMHACVQICSFVVPEQIPLVQYCG